MMLSFSVLAETEKHPLSDLSIETFEKKQLPNQERNPFTPEPSKEGLANITLNLEGIITGKTSLCLISSQVLQEGSEFGNFTVKSISQQEVVLTSVEGDRKLKMDNFIPRTSSSVNFDISFNNANLKDALRLMAAAGQFNIINPDDLNGRVSLNFHGTDLKDALLAILRVNGYMFTEESHIVRVEKDDGSSEDAYFKTAQIPLKYATASELLETIKPLLSKNGTAVADTRTNTITVKDKQTVIEAIWGIVAQADEKDYQVAIQAKILDVTKSFTQSIGIQWGFTKASGQVLGIGSEQAGSSNTTSNPYNVNLPAGNATSGIGLLIQNFTNQTDLEAQISAAEQNGNVHIISQPSVTTLNNVSAKIRSGVKIYVKSTSDISVGSSGSSASGSESDIQEINTGVELIVTPQISSDKTIKMKIDATESEADFSRTVDGIPSVLDNTASTTVLIRDGDTAVIGGLVKSKKSKNSNSVPGFGKIPVLGWLFKSKNTDKSDTELLIFITPRIVDKNGMTMLATPQQLERVNLVPTEPQTKSKSKKDMIPNKYSKSKSSKKTEVKIVEEKTVTETEISAETTQ